MMARETNFLVGFSRSLLLITEMNFVAVDQKDLGNIQFIQFTMQEDTQKRQNVPKFLLERFCGSHMLIWGHQVTLV